MSAFAPSKKQELNACTSVDKSRLIEFGESFFSPGSEFCDTEFQRKTIRMRPNRLVQVNY